MIMIGVRLTSIVLPRTDGDPSNLRCQNKSLTTETVPEPGF
jgi:hypothetical protein